MVSHRRSLYRQSTGRGASYGNDLEETITHWERVWVAPLPISTTNANGSAPANSKSGISSTKSPAANSGVTEEDQGTAQLSFKVKVWAQLENQADFVSLKDGDDDDYINLVAATNQAQSRKTNAGGQATNDSLSAADIRGAVGGGEEISISSYTSNEAKPKPAAAPAPAAIEKASTESAVESETNSTEPAAEKTAESAAPKEEESAKPEDSTESAKEVTKDSETTESASTEEPKFEAQSTSEPQATESKTGEKDDVEMEDSREEKKAEEDVKAADEVSESKAVDEAAHDGDVDMEDS